MIRTSLLALGALAAAVPAGAMTVVDLEGRVNASFTGANAVTIHLDQGRYQLGFTEGAFTAHNRWGGGTSGCDKTGASCTRGWETVARYYLGASDGVGGNDFQLGAFSYFRTRESAFAAAAAHVAELIVPAGGSTVSFYIPDGIIGDNRGGVSIGVSAIPEARTWAMLIAGFGLVGLAMRRRRSAGAAAA